MGIFKNIFTWWEGATFGTWLGTATGGERMGIDGDGNVYFQARKAQDGRRRRWVIYSGSNDASRVPPEWHSWLHNTVDAVPAEALPAPRIWEKEPTPNLTGTKQAYHPAGAAGAGTQRSAATGDYEAWSPDQA